jgi:hypothetical protein
MRARSTVVCALFIGAAAVGGPGPAAAGIFVAEGRCDTVSVQPIRLRLSFALFNLYHYGPLCRVQFIPGAFYGASPHPILATVSPASISTPGSPPSDFAGVVDSATGIATYTATPCLPSSWVSVSDSLALIVDGTPAYFDALLIDDTGGIRKAHTVGWVCADSTTTVIRRTWGQLKVRYR